MSQNKFDIIELMIKKELAIPLTTTEQAYFDDLDDEIKNLTLMLTHDYSYRDEIIRVIENINLDPLTLSEPDKQSIKNRCNNKIKQLCNFDF